MEIDPHTLSQILQRIYQQMRCPQCGQRVPVDFSSVHVVNEGAMLLQLKCDRCNAYIVLQASLQGIEHISVDGYEVAQTVNASSTIDISDDQLMQLRVGLEESGGSFEKLFEKYGTVAEEN